MILEDILYQMKGIHFAEPKKRFPFAVCIDQSNRLKLKSEMEDFQNYGPSCFCPLPITEIRVMGVQIGSVI